MAYTSQGHKAVGTADGNVDHLGQKHPPLFAAAIATLLLLWLPYTLYSYSTLLGQWLHICNCWLMPHMLLKIKLFLDVHYGPQRPRGIHHTGLGPCFCYSADYYRHLFQQTVPLAHTSQEDYC